MKSASVGEGANAQDSNKENKRNAQDSTKENKRTHSTKEDIRADNI